MDVPHNEMTQRQILRTLNRLELKVNILDERLLTSRHAATSSQHSSVVVPGVGLATAPQPIIMADSSGPASIRLAPVPAPIIAIEPAQTQTTERTTPRTRTVTINGVLIEYRYDLPYLLPLPHVQYDTNLSLLIDHWDHFELRLNADLPLVDIGLRNIKTVYKGTKRWPQLRNMFSIWQVCVISRSGVVALWRSICPIPPSYLNCPYSR